MLQGDPASEEVLKFLEEGEESVGGGNAKGGRVHKGVVPNECKKNDKNKDVVEGWIR